MGISVLILGESGSGKTTSLRNFQPGEIAIINVAKKPLPFRTQLKPYNTNDYAAVEKSVCTAAKHNIKSIVVDDIQYLMTDQFMRRSSVGPGFIRVFSKYVQEICNFIKYL